MIRRASGSLLLAAALIILGACGDQPADNDDDDESTTETTRGTDNEDVRFLNVEHDDGTEYRCIWRSTSAGGGLWCERLGVQGSTTTTVDPFDGAEG